MINPAIETDLVGELVRVDQPRWVPGVDQTISQIAFRTSLAGRVRAVTATPNGYLVVWIEIIDDDGRRLAEEDYGNVAIGDLFPCHIGGDILSECARLHILRGTR